MSEMKQIRNSTAEFLIFSAQSGGGGLEVRYENETIWLTQKLMARLFDVDVRTISEHLGNIYEQGEIKRGATLRKFRTVRTEGSREGGREIDHCNLDAIIALGHRFPSHLSLANMGKAAILFGLGRVFARRGLIPASN